MGSSHYRHLGWKLYKCFKEYERMRKYKLLWHYQFVTIGDKGLQLLFNHWTLSSRQWVSTCLACRVLCYSGEQPWDRQKQSQHSSFGGHPVVKSLGYFIFYVLVLECSLLSHSQVQAKRRAKEDKGRLCFTFSAVRIPDRGAGTFPMLLSRL